MESKIIELETLTTLFIKGKEDKYGEGFIRIGKNVFLIDNDKLCKYIYDSNKIAEYTQFFIERDSDVKGFLEYHGLVLTEDDIRRYEGNENAFKRFLKEKHEKFLSFEDYKAYKERSISYFLNKENIFPKKSKVEKDLAKGVTKISSGNRFTQNGNDKYYIPGSSLKGAIRNAILWKILSDSSKNTWLQAFLKYHLPVAEVAIKIKANDYTSAIHIINKSCLLCDKNLIENNKIDKNKFEVIQKKYIKEFSKLPDLNSYTIDSKSFIENTPFISTEDPDEVGCKEYIESYKERWKNANNTLRDFFRLVKVSDANFVYGVALKKEIAKAVCKGTSGNQNILYQKAFDIILECAQKSTKAHFKITIDTGLAKVFFPKKVPEYLQSVEGLLIVVNEFFRAVASFEDKKFYSGTSSIPNDENPQDRMNAKLKIDTTPVNELYRSTFGLKSEEILFRTGWGGGFMSKTQFLHLDISDRMHVRDMILYNGSPIAPKSRCLIVDKKKINATEPLGWCKLTVLGDAKDIQLPGIETATITTFFIEEQSQGAQPKKSNPNIKRNIYEKPFSPIEIKKLESASNAMLKQGKKQQTCASEKHVSGIVKGCDMIKKELVIKIQDQIITIDFNKMRYIDDPIDIEILEKIGDKITKVKINNESKNCK